MTTTSNSEKQEKKTDSASDKQSKRDVPVSENHRTAAKHHEEAAKHHREAAKHHDAGNTEKAHESTVKATGHHHLANKAQKKVSKTHAKSSMSK